MCILYIFQNVKIFTTKNFYINFFSIFIRRRNTDEI